MLVSVYSWKGDLFDLLNQFTQVSTISLRLEQRGGKNYVCLKAPLASSREFWDEVKRAEKAIRELKLLPQRNFLPVNSNEVLEEGAYITNLLEEISQLRTSTAVAQSACH